MSQAQKKFNVSSLLSCIEQHRGSNTYASPTWWGFTAASTKEQLEVSLRKAIKFTYYTAAQPCFSQIVNKLEIGFFYKIELNPHHYRYPLLPSKKSSKYDLRKRGHNFMLPAKDDRNFINKILYALL